MKLLREQIRKEIIKNIDYWKNIIPKDYKLTDRSGFSQEPLEDPTKGSLTPRIPRLVWVIDEEDDQTWNGGYYWPQLPKMTRGGVFSEPIDLEQYGGKNDLITSDKISDYYEVYSGAGESLFHLTFDADDVEAALLADPESKAKPPENPMSADRVKWEHIHRVFELCNRNVSETARRLKMHRRTLQRILSKRSPR